MTQQAYAYAGNNPTNRVDPTGMSWYDPRDWDQDVVGFLEDVGGRALDVATAVRNAPVTLTTAAINAWTGGDCDWSPHLTVVCYGGAVSNVNPFADTWTTGSTINTTLRKDDFASANCGGLLAHETVHTRQWALFGEAFPALYGLDMTQARLRTPIQGGPAVGSRSFLEQWAGLEGGGYVKCGC